MEKNKPENVEKTSMIGCDKESEGINDKEESMQSKRGVVADQMKEEDILKIGTQAQCGEEKIMNLEV